MTGGYHLCVVEVKDIPESSLENSRYRISYEKKPNSGVFFIVEILGMKRKNWLKNSHFSRFRGLLKYTTNYHEKHTRWFKKKADATVAKNLKIKELKKLEINILESDEATWTSPKYSRTQIRKSGDTLRESSDPYGERNALMVLDNWKASHELPLNWIMRTLRRNAEEISPGVVIVQRRKRTPSILLKLDRLEKLDLARMQDLVGCRIVFRGNVPSNNLSRIDELVHRLEKSRMQSVIHKVANYIEKPRDSGYRSVHVIYKYKSKKYQQHNNMLLEVQIRTRLQHVWSTTVESVGMAVGEDLKQGIGNKKWLRFFKLMSHFFSIEEGTTPVIENIDNDYARQQLRYLSEKLDATGRLKVFRKINRRLIEASKEGRVHMKTRGFVLMRLNTKTQRIEFEDSFEERLVDSPELLKKYSEWELEARNRKEINVLLVKTEDHKDLKDGFPNYFLDTKLFEDRLTTLIDL